MTGFVGAGAERRKNIDSIDCISLPRESLSCSRCSFYCYTDQILPEIEALEQIVHGDINVRVAYQIRIIAVQLYRCSIVIAPNVGCSVSPLFAKANRVVNHLGPR